MLCTTTPTIPGKVITSCLGLVAGESVFGGNLLRDLTANIRDVTGGRVGSSESLIGRAREAAVRDMCERARTLGAHAIVGVRIDVETLGDSGSMLLATALGTAVCTRLDEQMLSSQPDEGEAFMVQIGDTEKGPFTREQIADLIAAGRLARDTRVRPETGGDWRPYLQA